jgi:hypothetical protein
MKRINQKLEERVTDIERALEVISILGAQQAKLTHDILRQMRKFIKDQHRMLDLAELWMERTKYLKTRLDKMEEET